MMLVSPRDFKGMAIEARLGGRVIVRRQMPPIGIVKTAIEPVEDLEQRTMRFTISTGIVDRDRDKVAPEGWDTAHFQRNPVVLWSHQAATLPIGKVVELSRGPDRLSAAVQFLPAKGYGAASDFADQVYNLTKDGYLSATSVGFRPIKWEFTEDKERGAEDWFPGIDFHEQELVELSIVSVPSNPEALIDGAGDIMQPGIPPGADIAGGSDILNLSHERERRRRRLRLAEAMR